MNLIRVSFYRHALPVFLLLVAVLPVYAEVQHPPTVITKPNETREFKYLALENGLKVILIHDDAAEKSSASMDVDVGAGEDPSDRNGLAHFLEHMLFLGTDKYPNPGEFQDFISGHGGSHNAYTSLVNTNYFFDVKDEQFHTALDRFAQFFIAPSLDAEYVDRERNAVHSEFTSKYRDDYRRVRDVLRELALADHPMARFTTGNLDTLDNSDKRDLRRSLVTFYQQYYSSDRMALALVSSHPIAVMEQWVAGMFADIPRRKAAALAVDKDVFAPDFLPATVSIKPVKDQRQLVLNFPVPDVDQHYAKKPLSYLSYLIGDEREGSLLAALKDADLATGLSSGGSYSWRGGLFFAVTIALTEKGEQHHVDIERLFFNYVDLLVKEGINQWRFDELKNIGQIDFNFSDRADPLRQALSLSTRLQDTAVRDLLIKPNLYREFDQNLVRDYASYLKPANRLKLLLSQHATTARVSEIYATPYAVKKENPEALAKTLSEPMALATLSKESLFLPDKNSFIAKKFKVVGAKEEGAIDDKPELIYDRHDSRFWYVNDNFSDVPNAVVKARYYLPEVQADPMGYAISLLYQALLENHLNATSYEAQIAGLGFSLSNSMRGIDVEFAGYSDTLDVLAKKVTTKIKTYNRSATVRKEVSEQFFEQVKKDLIRHIENGKFATPYGQLQRGLVVNLYHPFWEQQDVLAALNTITAETYEARVPDLFTGFTMDALIAGNISRREASKYRRLLTSIGPRAKKVARPSAQLTILPKDSEQRVRPIEVSHSDQAALLHIQAPDDSLLSRAKMMLLTQSIETPFFNSLRTEQQLGYVVNAGFYMLRNMPGLNMLVQSPDSSAAKLDQAIDDFLIGFAANINDNFERNKRAVLDSVAQKPQSQSEFIDRFWRSIYLNDREFDDRAKLYALLDSITAEQMTVFYRDSVLSGQKRLWLFSVMEGKSLSLGKDVDVIKSSAGFKASGVHQVYP